MTQVFPHCFTFYSLCSAWQNYWLSDKPLLHNWKSFTTSAKVCIEFPQTALCVVLFECRVECFLAVGVSGDKGCQAVRLSRPVTRLRCSLSQAVRLIKLSAGISFSVCVGSVQSFRCLSLRLRRMMTTVIRAAIHTWLSCVLALVAINKTSCVSIESPRRALQYWFPLF